MCLQAESVYVRMRVSECAFAGLSVCLQVCVFVLRCVGVCEDVCIRTRKRLCVCVCLNVCVCRLKVCMCV